MPDQQRSLIVITGEEGAGKSTVMSALLPHTPNGAKIDAEDIGQVNPFTFDGPFLELLRQNLTAVIANFLDAGYTTVIAGSFLDGDTYDGLRSLRTRLPSDLALYVVQLRASKIVRDQRRIARPKPSSQEWRDRVDAGYPIGDTSLQDNAYDYRYLMIDNSDQQLDETVAAIKLAIPEVYVLRRAVPED
ncbi:hypothetical protein GCM10011575_46640 [Microlunatus endophyticus]|uniref:AAA domain-containing protein n=1 Tax=Microlunatus endophyticus TaxID=1716077 RepID=A0A917WA44_9ACTN|nr:hypothetical protein [Microlunatus endophyticus]GGL83012.1 hypothetical protein GCM10011575_46640 [Microlunatus endophyticus]